MACSVTLSSYSLGECFQSKGGVSTIWVANYVDNAYTTTTGGTISGISTGITWYKQEMRKNTSSMASTLNIDEANGSNYVQTDTVLEYSKMAKENRLQMAALSKGDLLLVVKDANGKYYGLGEEEPVHATAGDGNTGTDRGDKNAYTITLSDYNSSFPKLLDDAAIAIIEGA